MSTQRPCSNPTRRSRPAGANPNRVCSAAEAPSPLSAITAIICRAPASMDRSNKAPGSARPSPRPVRPGATWIESSTVCR
ncbi:hypothetical protein GCM10022416_41950 [Actinomadura keratinilytica]|uniref:Uncharacterized protein n=1 Tax=Actinomadura keratinilytica TaxID=547461 RepID=A0ABP7Z607_9ACTN